MVGGDCLRAYESVVGPAADFPSVVNIQMVNFVLCALSRWSDIHFKNKHEGLLGNC